MRHANIAFFIPHNGCPHQCSFCDQRSITGQKKQPSANEIEETLRKAADQMGERAHKAEVAFFGGSFTAIEEDYRRALLSAAAPFIRRGIFAGIRISTRPDAVFPNVLEELQEAGVTAIELGAQSMDDEVLLRNRRGHTARDVENASRLIHSFGFSLGLQMMTGLYGSSVQKDRETAWQFIALKPDTVRIYPTVVMRYTKLGDLYRRGIYQPPELEETVSLCAELLRLFESHGIPVIRLGLHDTPQLHQDALAGPLHPALRELCESRNFLEEIKKCIQKDQFPSGKITLWVNPKDISKAIGQKKSNIEALRADGYETEVKGDSSLRLGKFRIEFFFGSEKR